jgi:hypothetical protein
MVGQSLAKAAKAANFCVTTPSGDLALRPSRTVKLDRFIPPFISISPGAEPCDSFEMKRGSETKRPELKQNPRWVLLVYPNGAVREPRIPALVDPGGQVELALELLFQSPVGVK